MRLAPLITLALIAGCHDPQSTPTSAAADGAVVFNAQGYDVSPPLREIAKLPRRERPATAELGQMEEVKPNPFASRLHAASTDHSGEAVMQRVPGPAAISPTTANFEGQGAGLAGTNVGGYPPDTDGAVGPNHYVQVVNTSLAVFSKTGTVMMGPMDTSMVWSGFAGICATNGFGDGIVKYDQLADRWVISQFAFATNQNGDPVAPFLECIAISTSPDPTGTYTRYQYSFNNKLNDYPKIAMWPDAYYLTYNLFTDGSAFAGGDVCAMDRAKMLAGDPAATTQCFTLTNDFGLLVSDLDGKTLPPAGAPVHVVELNDSTSLNYFSLKVDFTTPANSHLSTASTITVPAYTELSSATTKGGTLASLGERAMNRFVYRNFGDHESLVLSHSVTTGVRWYEIRNATTPTLFQSGTYAPDSASRWMPSIAMDSVGEIALVYSAASSTLNPSIRYAARNVTDPPGTLGYGEGMIIQGTGAQPSNIQPPRWGDYASINIDPTDDCTFWATHEYYTMGKTVWSTRIASFVLPGCSSFALAQPDAQTVAQGGTATYPVTTSTTAGAAQSVTLTATGLPTGVTATFNPATVQSGASSQITLTADATAAVGSASYQVVATGAAGAKTADVSLTVTEKPATPDAGTGSGDGGSQSGGCCNVDHSSPAGATFLVLLVGLVLGRRRRR